MNDRWFAVGAFSGSPFERHADTLFDRAAPDRQAFVQTDVFYAAPDDPSLGDLPGHLLLLHEPLPDDRVAALLEPFPGRNLLSRTGHDIVNLFAPLADHQYLSAQTIARRIERGTRLGQQLNLAGHLLQGDLPTEGRLTVTEFLRQAAATAAQAGIVPALEQRAEKTFATMSERLAVTLLRELTANWLMHSRGDERIIVDGAARTVTFVNRTDYRFPFGRLKAVLRRPYQKFGNTEGNGLGLFLIALIAHTGGFSWDIASDGSSFSLSFCFGV